MEVSMRRAIHGPVGTLAAACLLAIMNDAVHAAETQAAEAESQPSAQPAAARSPWLFMPTFSSNPKLGTSIGAMGAYVTKFDPESQVSLIGLSGQYTDTDSAVVAAIARTSFGADHHRASMYVIAGEIKNDYDDYLGTGEPLKSEDNIRAVLGRYLYRFTGDWFVGGQFVVTNYQIVGQTALDEDVLDTLGLTGFEAGGVGLAVLHDSRDVQDKPSKGWLLNFNNVAYRESIAGSDDFEVYRTDFRGFWSHGDGNVVTVRQSNQWTVDAPASAYAPVRLRGYTGGEYLGKNMSSLEVEERHRLAERWTATFFAGVACLYGDGSACDSSDNVYSSVGVGVQYLLKPQAGLVANLEFAQGEDGDTAVIVKMGYEW
jgi:hypothetical protein